VLGARVAELGRVEQNSARMITTGDA
jgi:hypothetical protein